MPDDPDDTKGIHRGVPPPDWRVGVGPIRDGDLADIDDLKEASSPETRTARQTSAGMRKPEIMTTAEVARLLGVTPAEVRRLEGLGRISAERTQSGTRIYRRADMEVYAAAQRATKRVRPPLRTTYTVVTLDVSSRAFKEIYDKLQAAGYEHTFSENNTQIDMTGIAIVDSGE